jgi:hypothetical protein
MKKHLFLLAGFIFSAQVFAQSNVGSGPLFTVTGNGMYLNISTNIPNTSYQNAGIHINTAGVSPMTCNTAGNGYCFFSVSDTQTEYFLTQGNAGSVSMTLCLDARDQTNNCELHTAITNTPAPASLVQITAVAGPNDPEGFPTTIVSYRGTDFIPRLGPTTNTTVRVYGYTQVDSFVDCTNRPMIYFFDQNPNLQSSILAELKDILFGSQSACIALCNSNFTGISYNTNSTPTLCTSALYLSDYPPQI